MFDNGRTDNPDFNVGIDCEDIQRWQKMLPKLETGYRRKLFTEGEHSYCRSFRDPAPHYAVRWCAKEALLKAISPFYALDVRAIEIANSGNGVPFFVLHDPKVAKLNLTIRVSLTHSRETAMAVVMVLGQAERGGQRGAFKGSSFPTDMKRREK